MASIMEATHAPAFPKSGAELVSVDGRTLALVSTHLEAETHGGLATTTVAQRYRNIYEEPLAVSYRLPLPADGAVSGFEFEVAGRRTRGVVETRKAARERYEEALIEGRTAGLLEQERSSLFEQQLGNIPGGTEIEVRSRWTIR